MDAKRIDFKKIREWKRQSILLISIFVIFGFQNCATQMDVLFESLNSSEFKIQSTSGNGSGYEGKLTGHFIRTVPGDVCQGQALSTLDAGDSGYSLKSIDPLSCAVKSEWITDVGRLRWSQLQSEVVSVDDGVYFDHKKQNDQGRIETWCQATDIHHSNIDVLVYREIGVSDIQMKLFINQSSSGQPLGSLVKVSSLLPGQRKIHQRELRYSSSSYDLLIALDRFQNQERGDFQAHFTVQIDGKIEEQNLVCRIGQELDGAIWPSQAIQVSGAVLKKWPVQNNSKLLILIKPQSGPNQLVLYDLLKQTSRVLIQDAPTSGLGIENFMLDSAETKLIIVSDFQKPNLREVFSANLDFSQDLSVSAFVRISQARDAVDYSSMPSGEFGYDVEADSIAWLDAQTIYFRQGASKAQKITDGDKYLYGAKVDGSYTFPMNPRLSTPDAEVIPAGKITTNIGSGLLVLHGFGYHFDFGIVSTSGVFQDLHLLFSASDFMANQSVKLPTGSYLLNHLSKVFPSLTGDKIYFSVLNSNSLQMDVYQATLSTGKLQMLFQDIPLGDASSLKFDDRSSQFVWKDSTKSTGYVYDVVAGKKSSIPVGASLQFEVGFDDAGQALAGVFAKVENRFLYQIQTNGISSEQFIQLKDFQTGQTIEVPQTRMKLAKIYKMDILPERNAALIFADSNGDGDLELYLMSLQGEGLRQLNDRWKLYGSVLPQSLMVLQSGLDFQSIKVLFESSLFAQPSRLFLWDGN